MLDNADYTPATWGPFLTARTEAVAVRDDIDATQLEVNTALTNLQNAQTALVHV